MEIQSYLDQKIKLQYLLLEFLDDEINEDNIEIYCIIPDKSLSKQDYREELRSLLYLILRISNDHHQYKGFYNKIAKIFLILKEDIDQTFTKSEIFHIFKSNKRIILTLYETKIFPCDESIANLIIQKSNIQSTKISLFKASDKNDTKYCHYFYPEIKDFIDKEKKTMIKNDLLKIDPDIFNYFDEKRKIGQNDSYISELIRTDSVRNFISHINRTNTPLSIKIKPSIFESNSFLINKETTLIEYAAFFGSIQIFQYLKMNNVELKPSLWIYAIHGNRPELIHLLEDCHVQPEDKTYYKCLEEAIKCHHNGIANYINNNLINQEMKLEKCRTNYSENYIAFGFHYYNYESLYLAVNKNNTEIINFLLSQPGIKIPSGSFVGCKKLTKISIPSSTSSIEDSSFSGCSSLTEISIPSSLTSIGDYSFSECSSLTQILIPPSVAKIGKGAFKSCSLITEIRINSSIKAIEAHTFNKCLSLKTVIFESQSSITLIDSYAFGSCKSLVSISIPSSVNSIGSFAFSECSSLAQISFEEPSSIARIGEKAFNECSSLSQINIPSDIVSIESSVFEKCQLLSQIVMPSNPTSIGFSAFKGCLLLSQLKIPLSVISIGSEAFNGCRTLMQISIPSSVTKIESSTFEDCVKLIEIELPSSLKEIGDCAFKNCSSLKQISIPDSVTFIGKNSFCCCQRLAQVSIPPSVVKIGEKAFFQCSSLEKIKIPSSVAKIGFWVFKECSSLKQISLPFSLSSCNLGIDHDIEFDFM